MSDLPFRKVVSVEFGAGCDRLALDCGHEVLRNHRSDTPKKARCHNCKEPGMIDPEIPADAVEAAARALLEAMTKRALHGAKHVPSMRDEQNAACRLRETLYARQAAAPGGDAAVKYDEAAQDSVMRLLEIGKAFVDEAGYLRLSTPSASVERATIDVEWEVWQADAFGDGDAMVAGSTSLSEAQRYAAVYGQDGPAWVVEVTRRRLADGEGAK